MRTAGLCARLVAPSVSANAHPCGALPIHLSFSFELLSKQQYLRSRGLALRVRVPAIDWLAARLAWRPLGPLMPAPGARGGPWPAVVAAVASPLLVWQASELLTAWWQPGCWPAQDVA